MVLTATDILRIAECVENRVADFYHEAANRFAPPHTRALCRALADQNRRHALYWQRTRMGQISPENQIGEVDQHEQDSFKPESMVGLTWLGDPWRPQNRLTGHEDETQLLRDTVRRIRALTTFYQGLESFALDEKAIGMIERVTRMSQYQSRGIKRRIPSGICSSYAPTVRTNPSL